MGVMAFLWSIIPLSIVAVLILGDRSEPDPNRERPLAVYLGTACFVGVIMILIAVGGIVSGATSLTDRTDEARTRYEYPTTTTPQYTPPTTDQFGRVRPVVPSYTPRPEPIKVTEKQARNHDDDVTKIVTGVIVAALAAAVLRYHLPQLKGVSDRPIGLRVFTRYLYVTSFLTLLVTLGTGATALFAIYGTVAPDTAGVDSWTDSARQLAAMVVMAAVALALFRWHWTQALERRAAAVQEDAPPPEPHPVPKPETAPKKRAPRVPKS